MVKLSKTLLNEIRECASQLGPNQQIIQLRGVFNGFWVSLNDSEIYPSDRRRFREDDGIDRDGEYFLVINSL